MTSVLLPQLTTVLKNLYVLQLVKYGACIVTHIK